MSTTRTSLFVLALLAGVAYSVDSYVETRQPLDATSQLAERAATPPTGGDASSPELRVLELSSDAGADPTTQA